MQCSSALSPIFLAFFLSPSLCPPPATATEGETGPVAPLPAPVLRVTPSEMTSRDTTDLIFEYRPRAPLGPGDELLAEVAYSFTGENRDDMWPAAQLTEPDSLGYVWVEPVDGAELEAIRPAASMPGARVSAGAVAPGSAVRVHYRGRVQSAAIPFRFRGRLRPADGSPAIEFRAESDTRVLSRPAVLAHLITPGDVVLDEPFEGVVHLLDPFGNPDWSYAGIVEVEIPGGEIQARNVTAADSGRVVFSSLTASTPGALRPQVRSGGLAARSGPVWVHSTPPDHRRFFGDTHFHTGRGNGYRGWVPPGNWVSGGDHRGNYTRQTFAYHYARNVAGLDWASSSEHDVADRTPGMTDQDWSSSQDTADSVYVPGDFTTFYAWEWTHWMDGHRLIFYRDRGGPVLHRPTYDTYAKLMETLASLPIPYLVVPHVMEPNPAHEIFLQPPSPRQRIGEIYSHHNDDRGKDVADLFELGLEDPWSYRFAWSIGHRMGIWGSSDDHFGMPGRDAVSAESEGSGGLAVAIATENTREAIWEALEARRVYGTTGARILLDVDLSGAAMGSVISAPSDRRLRVRVVGSAPLAKVEVTRGQDDEYRTLEVDPEGRESARFTVRDSSSREALYYVRVTQKDGEMAWSSPIWVRGTTSR